MSRRSREAPGRQKTLRAAKMGRDPGVRNHPRLSQRYGMVRVNGGFWYRMELFQKEEDGSLTLLHITEEDAGGRTMQLAGYPDKSPMEPSVKEGETLSLKTLLGGLWTEPAETKVQKVEKYQEDHGFRYVIRHKVLQSVFPGTEGKELTGTINRTDTVRTGPDETVKEFVIQADSVYDVYEEMGAVVEYRIEFFSGDEAGNMELGSGTGPSE